MKHRGYRVEIRYRSLTFWTSSKFIRILGFYNPDATSEDSEKDFQELKVQEDAAISIFADQIIIKLRSDWKTTTGLFPAGSLIVGSVKDVLNKGDAATYHVLFTPTPTVSLSSYTKTKNFLILHTLDSVKSRLHFWSYSKSQDSDEWLWKFHDAEEKAVIRGASVTAVDEDENDFYWWTTSSFITPSTLSLGNATQGPKGVALAKPLKSLPHQFNSEGLVEAQFEAVSKDGTKVPYFIIYKDSDGKGVLTNRCTPTLLYGYGGFEISLTPSYAALVGSGWLEKGGCYVSANIRGGGEFGPSWHQAAKRENRQLAYDDFIAVAEDLIQRGITSPGNLGIRGGSNGGLLMGNMIVQRPDLFGAVCCAVPLLDMKIFNRLLAGNSWMAEYGNPDTDDWKFLKNYSPYHNIDAKGCTLYPPLLMTTSTRDDRVHPYHARCFVKRLIDCQDTKIHDEKSLGKSFIYDCFSVYDGIKETCC